MSDNTDGFTAKNYKGIPIAIEHHPDGSVTVCKEIAIEIRNNSQLPQHIRDYFYSPPPDTIIMTNDNYYHGD